MSTPKNDLNLNRSARARRRGLALTLRLCLLLGLAGFAFFVYGVLACDDNGRCFTAPRGDSGIGLSVMLLGMTARGLLFDFGHRLFPSLAERDGSPVAEAGAKG